jgi:hypothetical protein
MGLDMDAPHRHLLNALLDSWDRNNAILLNLRRAFPEGGLEAKGVESSPSIAELLTYIPYVRLVFVFKHAPEFAATRSSCSSNAVGRGLPSRSDQGGGPPDQ